MSNTITNASNLEKMVKDCIIAEDGKVSDQEAVNLAKLRDTLVEEGAFETLTKVAEANDVDWASALGGSREDEILAILAKIIQKLEEKMMAKAKELDGMDEPGQAEFAVFKKLSSSVEGSKSLLNSTVTAFGASLKEAARRS